MNTLMSSFSRGIFDASPDSMKTYAGIDLNPSENVFRSLGFEFPFVPRRASAMGAGKACRPV
jgi:hypothetical protein